MNCKTFLWFFLLTFRLKTHFQSGTYKRYIFEIFKHQFCEKSNCLQRMTQEVIDISKLIRLHGVLFHFYISAFKLLKNNSLPPLYLSQNLSEFFILDTDLWLCLSAFWWKKTDLKPKYSIERLVIFSMHSRPD